jgi:hypothetical protein
MDIPDALKYGASHSTIRTNRFRIVPQGSDSAQPNGVFRVRLPEKSLVRLSSLSAYFNGNLTGLVNTGAGNYANALMPSSYKFFRAVRFYVGGAIASGGLCNNYDQLYHQLLVSSADKAWVESRFNEGYKELIGGADDVNTTNQVLYGIPGATTKTQYLTCSDFLGLPRCNGGGGVIDTSLYSSVEVEFILNDLSILSTNAQTGSVAGVSWNLTNFRVDVDCVVSVSPMYVEMMALRLQDAAPIRFAYQNFITSISQNTGSNRIQVNSQSVDMLAVSPLRNNWAAAPSTTGMTTNMMQPLRYRFDTKIGQGSGSAADQQSYVTAEGTISFQLQVGSDTYPKTQITHALMIPDLTINTLYHGSLYSKNLFSSGLLAGTQIFSRTYGLSDNFVWINNFSLESEGWATKKLTGIDTSAQNVDIILNSSGFGAVAEPALPNGNGLAGNFWLITALVTSQLVYDPSTASVSIVA